jgi:hypothetical protein
LWNLIFCHGENRYAYRDTTHYHATSNGRSIARYEHTARSAYHHSEPEYSEAREPRQQFHAAAALSISSFIVHARSLDPLARIVPMLRA